MVFKSKVDRWVAIVLIGIPILILALSIPAFFVAGREALYAALGSLMMVFIIYLIFVLPVQYEFRDDHLLIVFGVIRYRIPYRDIRGISPTRSIQGSPALSIDRLAIDHGKAIPTLVSPKRREAFLEELGKRAPRAKIRTD
ncbi:MAG: PH domain-containing protein [Spirochaetota bacterium]